jgi:hypothetical protein
MDKQYKAGLTEHHEFQEQHAEILSNYLQVRCGGGGCCVFGLLPSFPLNSIAHEYTSRSLCACLCMRLLVGVGGLGRKEAHFHEGAPGKVFVSLGAGRVLYVYDYMYMVCVCVFVSPCQVSLFPLPSLYHPPPRRPLENTKPNCSNHGTSWMRWTCQRNFKGAYRSSERATHLSTSRSWSPSFCDLPMCCVFLSPLLSVTHRCIVDSLFPFPFLTRSWMSENQSNETPPPYVQYEAYQPQVCCSLPPSEQWR